MIEKKKYCTVILLTLLLGISMAPQAATTTEIADPDNEAPAFTSSAEAQHAANLAEQAATSDDSVKNAMQDVQEAQSGLDSAIQSNDPAAIDEAREELAKAESGYVDSLADITGVIGDDISSLRDSGMGWGEIAHELGVQPGLLGLGHTRGKQGHFSKNMAAEPSMHGIDQQELAEATARNMESGWSRGHGVGLQAGVHDPGTGLSDRSTGGDMGGGHGSSGPGQSSGHGGPADNSGGHSAAGPGSSSSSSASSSGGSGHSGSPGNSGGHSAAGAGGSSSGSGSSSGGSGHSSGSNNSGSSGNSGGHGNSGGSSGGHGNSGESGDHGGSEGRGR